MKKLILNNIVSRTVDPHSFITSSRIKKGLILATLLLLVLYVLLPQVSLFDDSIQIFLSSDILLLLIALGVFATTFILASISYQILSFKHLRWHRTLLVQVSNAFINRLLPAGVGGIGLNTYYLKKSGYSYPAAGAIVGANNVIGFIAHLLLGVVILIAAGISILPRLNSMQVVLFISIVSIILAVLLYGNLAHKSKLTMGIKTFVKTIVQYKAHKAALLSATGIALLLNMANILTLWLVASAVGASMHFATIFVIYTVGVVAATATPTPGGVVGAEAALVAGFVTAGITAPTAFAVALTFRFITYWIPIIPGLAAFTAARRKGYI